jgi:hypothetical protein
MQELQKNMKALRLKGAAAALLVMLPASYSKTRDGISRNHTLKSTRPTARGPLRQVFVAGVERAATFDEANQAIVSLVLL